MSILSRNSANMDVPSFYEIRKQASFFFREKIKTARLALTDVTPVQLLAEEATSGNLGGVDAKTLKMISKAAFEVDDYWRVVEILHQRLARFDKKNWRASYKALIVLENLLTHGPESVCVEFQSDRNVIKEMEKFQLIDEHGFNWGLNVRKKSERILKLLEKGPLYKEEREKARKITRGIEGFGSFNHKASEILQDSSTKAFARSHTQFNSHTNQDNFFSVHDENGIIKPNIEKPVVNVTDSKLEKIASVSLNTRVDSKENFAPEKDESASLLDGHNDDSRVNRSIEHDHPFDDADHLTAVSLL